MVTETNKNLIALAKKSYASGIPRFSDFLSVTEYAEFLKVEQEISYAEVKAFGGYENAERKVIGFGGGEFPIVCLKISPINQRFSDKLTHRDFLGSVLNLGLERSVIGDILVKGNVGYLFCLSRMEEYIKNNLTSINHTSVIVERWEEEVSSLAEKEEISVTVSSLRVDCIVSAVLKVSRSEAERLAENGWILVNGKPLSGDKKAKAGDTFAVRGKGKFTFLEEEGKSRKDRTFIKVERYV